MVLVQKWPFFKTFFLSNIGQENVFDDILKEKNVFLGCKKQKVQKVEKPMLLVKKWPFFQLFFLANVAQENVFYDTLERKNAFLGYKHKKFKKSKN